MRMKLTITECWVDGSPLGGSGGSRQGGKRPLRRKLTPGLCSAIEHSRPTAAGHVVSGERRVCNEGV